MSAGEFSDTLYEVSLIPGEIWKIRVQEEALSFVIDNAPNPDIVNTAPSGPATAQVSVKVNKGNREFGVRPRYLICEWTGSPPSGYSGETVRIPILRESAYNSISVGQVGSYNSTPIRVKAKVPEQAK